jgi:cobaltochelatase CobT
MAPADLISFTAHAWLRVMLLDESDYQPIADEGMALIEETLGAGVRTRLLGLLADQGLSMHSTMDAVDLSNAIVDMLKDEQEKANEPPPSQADSPSDNESQDDSQPDSDPQDGDDADDAGGQGDQSAGSQDDGAGQDAQGPQGLSDAQKAALAAAISGDGAEGFRDRGDQVLSQIAEASDEVEQSGLCSYTGMAQITPGGADQGTKPSTGGPLDTGRADRVSASLRQRLNVLLEAKSRAPIKVRDRGQRISGRHLVNLAVQDPRVFEHRGTVRKVDTAVMLIEDVSGSMSGTPIAIANGALYAACKALESHRGIKTAAMAFPGNGIVKGFDQPLGVCTQRFGLRAGGGTPLYEAVLAAARQLMLRREPRKLIVVLTDGEPDDSISAGAVLDALPGLGIEAHGIGICHDGVRDLFASCDVIDDLEALPGALIGLLQRQLLAA